MAGASKKRAEITDAVLERRVRVTRHDVVALARVLTLIVEHARWDDQISSGQVMDMRRTLAEVQSSPLTRDLSHASPLAR